MVDTPVIYLFQTLTISLNEIKQSNIRKQTAVATRFYEDYILTLLSVGGRQEI